MAANADYARLPADDNEHEKVEAEADDENRSPPISTLQTKLDSDERFHQPTPSPWKRLSLIVFLLLLVWLGVQLRLNRPRPVIHANRYSKEHKFRPAASPIITETLRDGRVRVRGAQPTARFGH